MVEDPPSVLVVVAASGVAVDEESLSTADEVEVAKTATLVEEAVGLFRMDPERATAAAAVGNGSVETAPVARPAATVVVFEATPAVATGKNELLCVWLSGTQLLPIVTLAKSAVLPVRSFSTMGPGAG